MVLNIAIIYAGERDKERALDVRRFFSCFFDLSRCQFFDSFDLDNFSNEFYEFGPLGRIIMNFNNEVSAYVVVNSTFCSGHSLLFRLFLIYSLRRIIRSNLSNDRSFFVGEFSNGFQGLQYFSSYFFAFRMKKLDLLDGSVSASAPMSRLRSHIKREFRSSVLDWVSYKPYLKGWHGASKSALLTRKNYKRKLVSIYYEYLFSQRILCNEDDVLIYRLSNRFFKVFDRILQLQIKVRNRYG